MASFAIFCSISSIARRGLSGNVMAEVANMDAQTGGGSFPTTDWGLFADLRGGNANVRMAALSILSRRYWRPVFVV